MCESNLSAVAVEETCAKGEGLRERAETALERVALRYRDRFSYLHAVMFVALVAIVVVPAFLPTSKEGSWSAVYSEAASFLVWGLWFPLLFASVLLFGRLWCGLLCPQGALSEYASRFSLGKAVPKWIRSPATPVASFIVITIVGQLIGVRDYHLPAMAVFVVTTLLAVVVGLTFTKEKRVWCRHLCPVGPLLGVLSRLGPVSFDKVGASAARPCPTFINTAQKKSVSHCIECFKCVDAPSQTTEGGGPVTEAGGGLKLRFRLPGSEVEAMRSGSARRWEVLFLFAATGLALGAFHWLTNPLYGSFKAYLGVALLEAGFGDYMGWSGPWWTMVNYPSAGEVFNLLDTATIAVFMVLSMLLVTAVLFVCTAASAALLRHYGNGGVTWSETFGETVTRLGYQYAPVALVSLVLGLGLVLFAYLGAVGFSPSAVGTLQAALFTAGALWSVRLSLKLQGGAGLALAPSFFGIGFVAALWYMVIF